MVDMGGSSSSGCALVTARELWQQQVGSGGSGQLWGGCSGTQCQKMGVFTGCPVKDPSPFPVMSGNFQSFYNPVPESNS